MNPDTDAIGVAPEFSVEQDVMSFESKIKTDLRCALENAFWSFSVETERENRRTQFDNEWQLEMMFRVTLFAVLP